MEPEYHQARPIASANCSMFYSILPSAIQSRLPRLPSLRRSATSLYGIRTPRKMDISFGSSSGISSTTTSGTTTPDTDYKDALVLGVFGPLDQSSRLVLRENSVSRDVVMQTGDDKSEIGWKFAHQGLNLLSLAVNETSPTPPQSGNAGFTRQLYLHAIAYLLRGLPGDLTMEEKLSLRSSLPSGIVEPIRVEINNSNASAATFQTERSLLHRTLASSIVQMFVLFQFVLPYFTYILAAAYQYDREHKIVQRGIAQGMDTLDKVGKTGIAWGCGVLEMGDGKVGQVVGELTKWVVEGVTGGIQEGVGEVMLIVGRGKSEGF